MCCRASETVLHFNAGLQMAYLSQPAVSEIHIKGLSETVYPQIHRMNNILPCFATHKSILKVLFQLFPAAQGGHRDSWGQVTTVQRPPWPTSGAKLREIKMPAYHRHS